MASNFLHLATTPAVEAEQLKHYGRKFPNFGDGQPDELGDAEREFIAARDSFYMATVTEEGWPYVQHRGGPAGFLKSTGPRALAFGDYTGNRQMLSAGNLRAGDRVALFLMDYPRRSRLKILGHAKFFSAAEQPGLAAHLAAVKGPKVERVVTIDVVALDWNCPKYITPRYTLPEIEELARPLRDRIAELERQLKEQQKLSQSA